MVGAMRWWGLVEGCWGKSGGISKVCGKGHKIPVNYMTGPAPWGAGRIIGEKGWAGNGGRAWAVYEGAHQRATFIYRGRTAELAGSSLNICIRRRWWWIASGRELRRFLRTVPGNAGLESSRLNEPMPSQLPHAWICKMMNWQFTRWLFWSPASSWATAVRSNMDSPGISL